jgi:PAS domain S-box-containing protein
MGDSAAPFVRSERERSGVVPIARARGPADAGIRQRVLVVEDDQVALVALEGLLRAEGFEVSAASDGEAGLAEASRALPDVVLTDLRMPGVHGVELCRRLQEIDQDLPVIVMTAHSDLLSAIESLRAGAADYLIKPLDAKAVLWSVERAIARRTAQGDQKELLRALNERLVLSSIREQEHAEAEALHRAQLSELLEHLDEGVVVADAAGRVEMMNDTARTIFGVEGSGIRTVEDLHSLDATDLGGAHLPSEQRPLMRALRGERFKDYEVLRIRPSGEPRRVVSTGTHVTDAEGKVVLAIVVFRDVTDLRRLEQERDECMALVSHDLRSPLSVVLLCLSAARRAEPDRMSRQGWASLLERAERNGKRMRSMIEELTEATSLEHGATLNRVPYDLREAVANVVDGLDDARAQRVAVETDDASPCTVLADPSRLDRVVANLLTNALKYSAEDTSVKLRLARNGTDVQLQVVDRGIGLAPESMKRVFERYSRTTPGKKQADGLGLGLYIARLFAEAHGGRIDVSSVVGAGSTFTLSLPAYDT